MFDARGFFDVEERGRLRLSRILPSNVLEHDGHELFREDGAARETVRHSAIAARLKLIGIELLVGEAQDDGVRAEVHRQFDETACSITIIVSIVSAAMCLSHLIPRMSSR